MDTSGKVLSIQSHVVSGYVGNKCATFPLQVLGFEVDTINSVQLSNHTGYPMFKGQVLKEPDLADLMEGLSENRLNHYTHLLTGYISDPTFLQRIVRVVTNLRKVNPNLIYAPDTPFGCSPFSSSICLVQSGNVRAFQNLVCDPVMGDDGKMYVPESLLPIYRDAILPIADIITPNQYEFELLTGSPMKSYADVWSGIETFHKKGCKHVIVSSTELGARDKLVTFASSLADGKKTKVRLEMPKLECRFTGAGDLFAALFLAWFTRLNKQLLPALQRTIASEHAVLKRTLDFARLTAGPDNELSVALMELRLIQSKADIESPDITSFPIVTCQHDQECIN